MDTALVAEMRGVVEADWLYGRHGRVLHHADLTDEQLDVLGDQGLLDEARLSCGQVARSVSVPGVFSRMGLRRCSRCCRAKGFPVGVGSPKNDPQCRQILGYRPSDQILADMTKGAP